MCRAVSKSNINVNINRRISSTTTTHCRQNTMFRNEHGILFFFFHHFRNKTIRPLLDICGMMALLLQVHVCSRDVVKKYLRNYESLMSLGRHQIIQSRWNVLPLFDTRSQFGAIHSNLSKLHHGA